MLGNFIGEMLIPGLIKDQYIIEYHRIVRDNNFYIDINEKKTGKAEKFSKKKILN